MTKCKMNKEQNAYTPTTEGKDTNELKPFSYTLTITQRAPLALYLSPNGKNRSVNVIRFAILPLL